MFKNSSDKIIILVLVFITASALYVAYKQHLKQVEILKNIPQKIVPKEKLEEIIIPPIKEKEEEKSSRFKLRIWPFVKVENEKQ